MARAKLTELVKLIDNTLEDLPVEEQFLNDLQRSIQVTDKNNARKPSQTFKPSGMNCMRASYYQIQGVEDNSDSMEAGFIGICESGSDRHERIQKAVQAMKDNGMDCEYVDVAKFVKSRKLKDIEIVSRQGMETKLYHKSLNMSFLCDGIIKYHNHYYILEIKTESSRKWYERQGVDPGHYNQATAYSIAFGIDEILFIYENRDVCSKKAFLFTVTDDMKQNLIGYIENTNTYLHDNKVPPKLLGLNAVEKKTCAYCTYKEQCRKDG